MGFLYLLICLAVWKADRKGDKANDLCKFVSKIMSRTILTPSKEISGSERRDFSLNRRSAASRLASSPFYVEHERATESINSNSIKYFPPRLTVHLLFHAHLSHLFRATPTTIPICTQNHLFRRRLRCFLCVWQSNGAKRLKLMRRQTRVNDWGWKKWIKA